MCWSSKVMDSLRGKFPCPGLGGGGGGGVNDISYTIMLDNKIYSDSKL